MNASEIEALFARTLIGDHDDEGAWEAVHKLRSSGSREVFDRAAEWCRSDNPSKRARAADVLCQLQRPRLPDSSVGETEWLFVDESYSLVTKMLEKEQDHLVLDCAIFALGHLANAHAVPLILRFKDHSDENIRFAVACALGHFPNEPESINGLLKLTGDPDADVRDWAVFGLGVLGDSDSPEIRDALLRCLNDTNEDVREEAAAGLGKRRDQRVIPMLETLLDEIELRPRVVETLAGLLSLDEKELSAWTPADCRAALAKKFNPSRKG